MLDSLLEVESFYGDVGGIVGYHVTLLRLIASNAAASSESSSDNLPQEYLSPNGLDLAQDSPEVSRAVRRGIESLPQL
jgi:hypothetical protein